MPTNDTSSAPETATETGSTRACPYCAEQISSEAVLCRFCRSRTSAGDPRRWHRDYPTRKLAGVASGVSRALALPLGLVRAAFVIALLFQLAGLFVYLALWLAMPLQPGGVPPYRQAMAWIARQVLRLFGNGGSRPGTPPAGGPGSASLDVLP